MTYIDVAELYERLIETPDLIIIDVRSPEEYHVAHIPQARLVPMDTFLMQPDIAIEKILDLIHDQEIIYIICLSDRRSFMASHALAKQNIFNTCFIKGGTQNWIACGYPVVSGS